MSYWSLLEESRRALAAGRFAEAERCYFEACAARQRSRFRAPLMEGAVEPLLHKLRNVIGRAEDDTRYVPAFARQAARLREDLEEVARRLVREARARWVHDGAELATTEEIPRLAVLLELQGKSRILRLPADLLWPVHRAYLSGCVARGLAPDGELLRRDLDMGVEELAWLVEWAEARGRTGSSDLDAVASWALPHLMRAPLAEGDAFGSRVLALACRLAVRLPEGAPLALRLGRDALSGSAPPPDAAGLLRLVAGLACNEERLARGWVDVKTLVELESVARQLDLPWPPAELSELLRRRRPGGTEWAVLATDPGEQGQLVMLRLRGLAPVDALLLQPGDDGHGRDHPFACSMTEARAILREWLDPDSPVLCETLPDSRTQALLVGHSLVAVAALEDRLAAGAPRPLSPPPSAPHPVFASTLDPVAQPWEACVDAARELPLRVGAVLDSPAFRSSWGLANLEAWGRAGLGLAASLAQAVRALASAGSFSLEEVEAELQDVPGSVALSWPRLAGRPWPRGEQPALFSAPPEDASLVVGTPTPRELAGTALGLTPCEVWTWDSQRARETAASAAARVDARRVTVAPETPTPCPEAMLELLDRWTEESVGNDHKALDLLWLYRVLATTPDGTVEAIASTQEGAHGVAAREALRQAQHGCTPACRLRERGGCFEAQLRERARLGLVWVTSGTGPPPEDDLRRNLVVDDLVRGAANRDDPDLAGMLDALASRGRAPRMLLWARAPWFSLALADALRRRCAPARTFQVVQAWRGTASPPALFVEAPGYAPGSLLLAEEAEQLTASRLELWWKRAKSRDAVWLFPGGSSRFAPRGRNRVEGAAEDPSSDLVLVPRLARAGNLDPAVALLRLACAFSHAASGVASLDPRVRELLGGPEAWAPEVPELSDRARVRGADLLDRVTASGSSWRRPLGQERLENVARLLEREWPTPRLAALARALAPVQKGNRILLGAARDDERWLVAAALTCLAREAVDGGPLRTRTVIWVDETLPPELASGFTAQRMDVEDAEALEDVLLASDMGEVQLLWMVPELLANPALTRWSRRSPETAWVVPQAARAWPTHAAYSPALKIAWTALAALPRESGPLIVAFVDDADPASDPQAQALAAALECRVETVREADDPDWTATHRRVADPAWTCSRCRTATKLPHFFALCTHCAAALLRNPEECVRARDLAAAEVARWFSLGETAQRLVVTADLAEAAVLQRRLGVGREVLEDAPLLQGRGGEPPPFSVQVRAATQLWRQPLPTGDLVWPGVPDDPAILRAVLARLECTGMEARRVEFLDHPLLWSAQTSRLPLFTHGSVRWRVSRTELDFAVDQGLSAVTRALRGEAAGDVGGIGPASGVDDLPAWQGLVGALVGWRLLSEERGRTGPRAAADLVPRAKEQLEGLLAALVDVGLDFDTGQPCPIAYGELPGRMGNHHGDGALLSWLLAERMLEATERPFDVEADAGSLAAWQHRFRASAPEEAVPLAPWPVPGGDVAPPAATSRAPEWVLGVPGSGKTRMLAAVAAREEERLPGGVLVVTGRGGLLDWSKRLRQRGAAAVELATVQELGLAFLRRHHGLGGFAAVPRLLPPAWTAEGDDVRNHILQNVARRYALARGERLAVDVVQLRRILESAEVGTLAASATSEDAPDVLDIPTLMRCAEEARRAAGWVEGNDLSRLSRRWLIEHPYLAESWSDRFPAVIVDDLDALAPEERAFLELLYPEASRWNAADPDLLPRGSQRPEGHRISRRMPRNLGRAAAVLLREDLHGVHPLHARGKGRGNLLRHHVLNLEACARRIVESFEADDWSEDRVGVVVTFDGDIPRLSNRLAEGDVPVWTGREVTALSAPGPRGLLLVLGLVAALEDGRHDDAQRLARALLEDAGHSVDQAGDAPRWLRVISGETAPASVAESFLAPVGEIVAALDAADTLAQAAQVLEVTGPLAGATATARTRREQLVGQRGSVPWRDLLHRWGVEALVDPMDVRGRAWLVERRELAGLDLDRVFYLCSGHEPPEDLYRVLGATTRHLTILFSDADPLRGRA